METHRAIAGQGTPASCRACNSSDNLAVLRCEKNQKWHHFFGVSFLIYDGFMMYDGFYDGFHDRLGWFRTFRMVLMTV
jgi:hypothetical protein